MCIKLVVKAGSRLSVLADFGRVLKENWGLG
jgi:hypothetical protein